jgi:hypothetical protein
LLAVVAVSITACRSEAVPNTVKEALAQAPPTRDVGGSVAFRFPASGGEATLYRLPEMNQVTWRFEIGRRSTERIVGFSSDNDLIFTLAERDDSLAADLRALDLVTGRSRTLDSNVIAATVGPTGQAFFVRADGTIGEAEHRRTDSWPDTLVDSTLALWGAARGRLVARVQTDVGEELVYLARGQTPVRQPLPSDNLAVSRWGRLVAVAVDSGVITLDPANPEESNFTALSSVPQAVTMSPSGHRVYVAEASGRLVALERFAGSIVQQVQLPGPAVDLRADEIGRVILALANDGSIWTIDLASFTVVAMANGSWDRDLPTVAADGTILVRQGDRIVALRGEDFGEAAAVRPRGDDRWLTIRWDPRRPALEFARDSVQLEDPTGVEIYVQVSSSGNPAWAEDLASELRTAGLDAKVLQPDFDEERYRVVLGPFATREEAEANGRQLGRAFWIFTREPDVPREPDIPIP